MWAGASVPMPVSPVITHDIILPATRAISLAVSHKIRLARSYAQARVPSQAAAHATLFKLVDALISAQHLQAPVVRSTRLLAELILPRRFRIQPTQQFDHNGRIYSAKSARPNAQIGWVDLKL
jgi:hypothetical protein